MSLLAGTRYGQTSNRSANRFHSTTPLSRSKFLELEEVESFINWFVERIRNWTPVRLEQKHSKHCLGGLNVICRTFEDVYNNYEWRVQVPFADGVVTSTTFAETEVVLTALQRSLGDALQMGNSEDLLEAMVMVLKWGGVDRSDRGARPYLEALHEGGRLLGYAERLRKLASASGQGDYGFIDVFNSGLTKIASLMSGDSIFAIYDSRVAAAIAYFVARWSIETKARNIPSSLAFPCAGAPGSQVRNPGMILGPAYRMGTLQRTGAGARRWVDAQARISWIIEQVLVLSPELFQDLGTLNRRGRAFEAALFMLGYDLANLGAEY